MTEQELRYHYTVEQVAQALQLHPTTVRRFCRQGALNAVRYGRSWRIPSPTGSRPPTPRERERLEAMRREVDRAFKQQNC